MAKQIDKTCKVRYRVVLYRFNFDVLKCENSKQFEEFFFLDPTNLNYEKQVTDFSKVILDFYKALYRTYKTDENFFEKCIIEYDITPLVMNINVTNQLENVNSCSISCSNILYGNLTEQDIINFKRQNKWFDIINTEDIRTYLNKINGLVFREYDFIRIYIIGDRRDWEDDITYVYNKPYKDEKEFKNELLVLKEALEFQFRPIFTGVVKSIFGKQMVDSVFSIELHCIGMLGVFGETSLISDQALYNAISIENKLLPEGYSVFLTPAANRFQGLLVHSLFVEIIDSFLRPYKVKISKEIEKEFNIKGIDKILLQQVQSFYYMGLPKSKDLIKSLYKNFEQLENGSKTIDDLCLEELNFIPFFFILLIYHIVKEKYLEKIFYIPDLDFSIIGDKNLSNIVNYVTYLLMFKDQFSLYDASYTTALSIFDDIRKNVFLDIFEDGSGCIVLQIPRFANERLLFSRVIVEASEINSSEINISDSANHNAIGIYQSQDLIGAFSIIPAKYYIDYLSAFRFGLRVTNPVSNPNVRNNNSATLFSKFYRIYYLHKYSRRASINIVGVKDVKVGENLIFQTHSFSRKIQDLLVTTSALGVRDYLGYVDSINYSISIDSVPTQNISLSFLRSNISYSSTQNFRYFLKFGKWDFIKNNEIMPYMDFSSLVKSYRDYKNYFEYPEVNVYNICSNDFLFYHPIRDTFNNSVDNDVSRNKIDEITLNKNLIELNYIFYKQNQILIEIFEEALEKAKDIRNDFRIDKRYFYRDMKQVLNLDSKFKIKTAKIREYNDDDIIKEISNIGKFDKKLFGNFFPKYDIQELNKQINNIIIGDFINFYTILKYGKLTNTNIETYLRANSASLLVGKDYQYAFYNYFELGEPLEPELLKFSLSNVEYDRFIQKFQQWQSTIKDRFSIYGNKIYEMIDKILESLINDLNATVDLYKKRNGKIEEKIRAICDKIKETQKKEKKEIKIKPLLFHILEAPWT